MQVKTDTKEKFHVITVKEPLLTASMTEDLTECLMPFLQKDVKNVVLVLKETSDVERPLAEKLLELQQLFYENGASFVISDLQTQVEDQLDKEEILELLNITPTESEAYDIVQMEEIEREMFGEDN